MGDAAVENARRGYYGSVSFVDEQIGRILETLDRKGLLKRTLVIYLSDHGDMLGDQYLWRKSYAYQGSARIPMMVHWPEGMPAANRAIDNPVEIRDVLPTLLDAAGASVPRGVDGASLLKLAKNSAGWRPWIDLEHDVCYAPENHWNALTDGRRKYIFHAMTGEEQFFDLENDPHELKNLAGDAEVAVWRERLIAHLAVRGEPWVVNGRLGVRPRSQLYSPNYPK